MYWCYLFLFQTNLFGRVSVVVIHCAKGWTDRFSNPGRGSPSDFETCRDRPWGPTSRHFKAYGVSFLGAKWPERDVDHLLQSSVEVETVWNYISIPCPTPSCTGRLYDFLYFLSLNYQHVADYIWCTFATVQQPAVGIGTIKRNGRRHVIMWKQRSRFKGPSLRVGDNYLEKN